MPLMFRNPEEHNIVAAVPEPVLLRSVPVPETDVQ